MRTDIKIDLEEFEELWVEKAEKVAAKKKVRAQTGAASEEKPKRIQCSHGSSGTSLPM